MLTGRTAGLLALCLGLGACGADAQRKGDPNDTASGGLTGSGGSVTSSGGTSFGTGGISGGAGEGAGLGGAGDDMEDPGGCAFSGRVTYALNGAESWPADVTPLITEAMDLALHYYNCYADLEKAITVNYDPGVPTAQANVDGWLTFGSNKAYMQVATAMHEVAHTLRVGYYPWQELLDNGRWTGPHVDALMKSLPAEERDPDMYSQRDYITADSQHFWPYGLNQASEYQSEWSLINHVRIVAAMHEDKQAYLNGEL